MEPDDTYPTDEQLAALRSEAEEVQTRLDAKLSELEAMVARDEERRRQSLIPTMQPDAPPKTAAEKLEVAEKEFERIVVDPESDYDARHRARILLDRAALAAKAESDQQQRYSQMARSLATKAQKAAERDVAERKFRDEREAAQKAADDIKWSHAKQQQFLKHG